MSHQKQNNDHERRKGKTFQSVPKIICFNVVNANIS